MFVIKLFLVLVSVVCIFFLTRLLLHRTALIHVVRKFAQWLDDLIHVHQHFKVPELDQNGQQNMFYRKVYLYVNSLQSVEDSDFTNLFSGKKSNEIVLHLDDDQVISDIFLGAKISWTNQILRPQGRSFLLKMKKKDKRRILRPYLQHIHTVSDDIQRRTEETKLFINNLPSDGNGCNKRWRSIPFSHPSTFETIVMDGDLKSKIKSDLDSFLKSEQYYHKLGRVWKRSYLLHGPSGTGKSSFIAAMANYLSFDVYDVDLSRVTDDSDLKLLLLQTTTNSIIVVEDLDRFFTAEKSTISLTGMLNFMDGIANSCCGDSKIMIFTVNNKEKIEESAILRPGRIDVHIHFPLCDFISFKSLASSYLGLKEHKYFPQVEDMFQSGAAISPAEIGELMLANRSSPSRALKSVISAMQSVSAAAEGKGSGVKVVRRGSESTSSSSPLPPFPMMSEEHGGGKWREVTPAREIRKLYGLLRMKSSNKSGPLDCDSEMIQR